MDLARARFLVSDRGRRALDSRPADLALLPLNQLAAHLRHDYPSDEAAALSEQLTLCVRAAERFDDATGLLFTADGLAMMTHPEVAARRAARLATLDLPIADLTCGLGGDLRECAKAGLDAIGLDRDRVTALLVAANVPAAAVVQADATYPPIDMAGRAVIIDPSRRSGASRRFDPSAFSPPWDVALRIAAGARAAVLKGPPGIDDRHLPPSAELEWVQVGRSLREVSVWLGAGACPGYRRAVLLPSGATIDSMAPEGSAAVQPPGDFIFDPEPCVTNAGLVRHLAARLGASLMDEHVAYLTSSNPAFDPLAATFHVLDRLPFSVAALKKQLRDRAWKPDEIRRRAFPIEPDELRRLLGPVDGEPVTLLCTTLAGKRTIVIARRIRPLNANIA